MKAFEGAMNRLFAAGRIRMDEVGPTYRRRKSLVPVGPAAGLQPDSTPSQPLLGLANH